MKQIYHPYWKLECYNNGMWGKVSLEKEAELLPKAITFTGNHIDYGNAMIEVVENWKYCIEHHLTDNSINQKAYIGHAACSFKHKFPEYIVRMAWHKLTKNQQDLANEQAEKAINYWKSKKLNYAQTVIRF